MSRSFILKIRSIIAFTVVTVIIVTIISTHFVIAQMLNRDFQEKSQSRINQISESINLYMDLLEETANLIMNKTVLIDALMSKQYRTDVVSMLDSVRNTNSTISGISIYTTNNLTYVTSGIESPPTYEWLTEQGLISEKGWRFRADTPERSYRGYNNIDNGIYTYIVKVVDEEGGKIGVMLIDTLPSEMAEFFVNKENDSNIDVYFNTPVGESVASVYNKSDGDYNKGYFKYELPISGSNLIIKAYVSKEDIAVSSAISLGITAFACLIILIVFGIVLKSFTKSLYEPINNFGEKIAKYAQSKTFDEEGDLDD